MADEDSDDLFLAVVRDGTDARRRYSLAEVAAALGIDLDELAESDPG